MPDHDRFRPGGTAPAVEPDDDGYERRSGRAPIRLPARRLTRRAVGAALAAAVAVIATAAVAVTLAGRGASAPQAGGVVPPARQAAAMAFDSSAGLTVMYGGMSADQENLYDTWLWDGSSWSAMTTSVTPRIVSPALTDDPSDGGVLLVGGILGENDPGCAPFSHCGGFGSVVAVETWLYRGGGWQRVGSGAGEPGSPVTLATDPVSSDVVAVVDTTDRNCAAGTACPLTPTICTTSPTSDGCLNSIRISTWHWTNRHWTASPQVLDLDSGLVLAPSAGTGSLELVSLVATAPSCGSGCPLVAPASQRAWRWASAAWVPVTPGTDLPPLDPGVVAERGNRAVLLADDGRVYELSGTWTQLDRTAPTTPRFSAAFAADRDGGWVLFGGTGPQGGAGDDTWVLDGSAWHHVSGRAPVATRAPGATALAGFRERCASRHVVPQYSC